ncbi:MAG: secondary thiamine-phosphate synthase enzyme YjbQ [Paludibacteraceae bacterium]|jgi:secondary thiamine-phosphate synthase enzyme|nr:secondary thiamine-phosphate synthase enzyme YjbQ [Paludibacteraceae bacterium]
MYQIEFSLKPYTKGYHLITEEIKSHLAQLPETGILNLFVKHTSCGLTINENADPDVREDFERVYNKLVPENAPYYAHTIEGPDDMPAHIKSSMIGVSLNIPISHGKLNLGTWQGIYLCEFRHQGGARKIVATIIE